MPVRSFSGTLDLANRNVTVGDIENVKKHVTVTVA